MTRAPRVSLRATGQIGILAITVNLAVATASLVISHLVYAGRMQDEMPWLPIFYTGMAVSIVLGLTPLMSWLLLTKLATGMFWLVGGVVCLALSYLGQPLGRCEPGALRPSSLWIIVPTYLVSLISAVISGGGPLSRETFAATLAIAVLAVELGLHLVTGRCGLVCLRYNHAQPKKGAAPVFRRVIASHTRALAKARAHGEPAGQLAARELELDRLRSALRRAEELHDDVARALESAG